VLVALLWACRAAPAAPRLAMSLSTDWPDSWPWRDPSRDSRCADAPCTGINERMPVETLPMAEVAPWRGEWQHVPFITGHGGLYLHWTSSSHDGGVQLELSHHGEAWLALGVSVDGHMVEGGKSAWWQVWRRPWRTPRPSAAIVAHWPQGWTPGSPVGKRYALEGYDEDHVVRLGVDSPDGMGGNGVAGLPYAQEGPSAGKPSHTHGGRGHPKPEVQVRRIDGWSKMSFTLPYTDECGRGEFAICKHQRTYLLVAHGGGDYWPQQHPLGAAHRLHIPFRPEHGYEGPPPPPPWGQGQHWRGEGARLESHPPPIVGGLTGGASVLLAAGLFCCYRGGGRAGGGRLSMRRVSEREVGVSEGSRGVLGEQTPDAVLIASKRKYEMKLAAAREEWESNRPPMSPALADFDPKTLAPIGMEEGEEEEA